MSFWHSGLTAGLALAGGLFSCSLLGGEKIQFSIAGINSDKIEFTAPTAPIDVPAILKEDRIQDKFEYHPADSPDRLFMEDNVQAYGVVPDVVVVNPSSKRISRTSDDSLRNLDDSADTNSDSASSFDRMGPQLPRMDSVTNSWDRRSEFDDNIETSRYQRRADDATSPENFHSRFDALSSANTSESRDFGERNWRNPNSNSGRNSPWSVSYFHHDWTGFGRSGDSQEWTSYSEMIAAASRAQDPLYPHAPTATVGQDALQNARQPGLDYNNYSARNAAGAADSAGTALGNFNDPGTTSLSAQNPYSQPRPRPSSSLNSQPREVPAILPFPKRPGDVFQ